MAVLSLFSITTNSCRCSNGQILCLHTLLKICSVNDAVEMTVNQFQQNISIKLADDYLSTGLTGNVMKFPVDLTKIFNSVAPIVSF